MPLQVVEAETAANCGIAVKQGSDQIFRRPETTALPHRAETHPCQHPADSAIMPAWRPARRISSEVAGRCAVLAFICFSLY